MSQLFKRRANSIANLAIVGGIGFVLVVAATLYGFAHSDFLTQVGAPIDQPVPFSHQHHVGDLGIDCRYCHTGVEKSPYAGVPPTETCMTCHSQIWKDAPPLQPIRESWATGRAVKWQRVHDLPDYVYFNHSIHVNKGVGCATCHGQVNEMPLTWKNQALYMRWCLDCHRAPEKYLRPVDQVESMSYRPPPNQLAFGKNLIRQNHIQVAGLTDCYTCHR
ncbi:MAG: cytochrome c3 family protein [Chthoniobacterales bacterium]